MSTFSAFVGQHFAYAAGRTGVLQQILLTTSDRDRLLGAKDLAEAERILTEIKMTNPIDQGLKKGDDILHAIEQWIRKEVQQMTPASMQPAFSILWSEGTAPLLAYLLKQHFGLTSEHSTEPSDAMASYNSKSLRMLIENGKESTLPTHLVSFVQGVLSWEMPEPKRIDAAVAAYNANVQLTLARTSGSALILRFVRHKIDCTNIRTALRLVTKEDDALPHLIQGGTIPPKALIGDRKSILTAIDRSPLPYSLSEALQKAGSDANMIELALSTVIADDIAHMWNIPLSIEPIFAFAALAQMQLALLRVLLIGKRANMSPQEIKHVLPPFLSAAHYLV